MQIEHNFQLMCCAHRLAPPIYRYRDRNYVQFVVHGKDFRHGARALKSSSLTRIHHHHWTEYHKSCPVMGLRLLARHITTFVVLGVITT